MKETQIQLEKKLAAGYEVALGPVNLVFAVTDVGLVGCGAIDVAALDKFTYPAARVKATHGPSIVTVADLLSSEVKEANEAARKLGVKIGMSGREALEHF